ncbi:MAG: hypothetical protein ABIZ49_00655 [Opitutaceae bacterium]
MIRPSTILMAVAICGAVSSAILALRVRQSQRQFLAANTHAAQLTSDLATASEQTAALKTKAAALESDLATITSKLTAAESRATQAERDYVQAKAVVGVYEATSRALADEVSALRNDLADARGSNASPEAVAAYKNTIAELERQLASSRNGAAAPMAAGASTAVFTNRVGRATVLTVGPESAFVVLNFGAVRGAQIGQKMDVSQGTRVVATVLISDVRPNFSIAQVLPDSLRGVLQKGDSAVLLR